MEREHGFRLTMRSWGEFFEKSQFDVPDATNYQERVKVNVTYYQANYLALSAVFMLYVCFARPIFILPLGLVCGGGYWLFKIQKQILVTKMLGRAFAGGTCVLMLLFGGMAFVFVLSLAALVSLLHSSFRKRSMKAAGSAFYSTEWRDDFPTPGNAAAYMMEEGNMGVSVEQQEGGSDDARAQQEKQRQEFRSRMRAKYGRKDP